MPDLQLIVTDERQFLRTVDWNLFQLFLEIVQSGGISAAARSGLYVALRARGVLVGLVAVEFNASGGFREHQSEVVHGLSEPFGIAIDNARMFRGIRTLAADEERSRIARDLHDLVIQHHNRHPCRLLHHHLLHLLR